MVSAQRPVGDPRIESIGEAVPLPVWTAAPDGACDFVNRRWSAFTGRSADGARGDGWCESVHEDDRAACLAAWRAAVAGSHVFDHAVRLRGADGRDRRVRLRAELLRGTDGRPERWFGTATDLLVRTDHDDPAATLSAPAIAVDAPPGGMVEWFAAAADVSRREAAEARVRFVGESLRQLVEQSPFGVYAVDADFRLAMVSRGAQRVFRNVRPLLGRDFAEVLRVIWPEPFASDALARFRHTLETGEPYHAPSTVEHRADVGDLEAYDWKLDRVMLPDGRAGVVCHFYDLSERQRYEEAIRTSEHRYRTLLDATHAVTWTHPPPGRTPDVEPQPWTACTGHADGDGHRWITAVHPDDAPLVRKRWAEAAARGVTFESEHRVRRHDGGWCWVQVTAAPIHDASGALVEWFGANVDVTDRRRAEEELRQADRRKDQFVAILAHELRNPLAPIRTSVALLESRPIADPLVVRARDVIDRQVGQMARLLDDLLDVSRLSRGTLTLQRTRTTLEDVLAAAAETAAPLVEQRGQSLVVGGVEAAMALDGDPARLTQVFGNLLTNAAKYSPPGATITVTARLESSEIAVAVRDTGIGIAAEHLPSVFDLFAQFDPGDAAHPGGLGIGLALVRHLVALHGGTIEAASHGLGHGSTFTVRLPAEPSPAATTQRRDANPSLPAVVPRRRVLVADDNADAADTLTLLLEQLGCDVRTVYAGAPAVHEAETFQPEVAFLDLGLPDLDGWDVCRRLRALPSGARMVLVALTGWGGEEDRERTREAGFDRHLVKPADPETLLRLIAEPTVPS